MQKSTPLAIICNFNFNKLFVSTDRCCQKANNGKRTEMKSKLDNFVRRRRRRLRKSNGVTLR